MNWVVASFETDKHLSGGKRSVWVVYKHTTIPIYRTQKEIW